MKNNRDISKRVHAEDKILENVNFFRVFTEQSSEGIAIINEEGRVVEWNLALEKITGQTIEKALGMFAWDVHYQLLVDEHKKPEALARAKTLIETALQTGDGPFLNKSTEVEYRHSNGSKRFANQKLFPIRVGENYWIGMISSNTTKTEKHHTEMRKLYRAIDQSDSAIVITNLKGAIEFINPAFTKISGFTLQEAIGENPSILNSGEMEPDTYKTLWKTIIGGDVWEGELLNRKKNGELYWEYATISPVKNDSGIITHFVGVKENLTERKLAELSLKESELKFRTFAEQSPNMIFINKSEEIVYANNKCEEILKYTKAEMYAHDFNFLSIIAPESKDSLIANFHALADDQDIPPFEFSLLTKEGGRRDVIMASRRIRYLGDTAILGTVTDITDRKKTEDLIKRQVRYQQALVKCSQALNVPSGSDPENLKVLTQALTHLLEGMRASRAYKFAPPLDRLGSVKLSEVVDFCQLHFFI